jgi:hypothetical protein
MPRKYSEDGTKVLPIEVPNSRYWLLMRVKKRLETTEYDDFVATSLAIINLIEVLIFERRLEMTLVLVPDSQASTSV